MYVRCAWGAPNLDLEFWACDRVYRVADSIAVAGKSVQIGRLFGSSGDFKLSVLDAGALDSENTQNGLD